ncbi:MAG TPA: GNAT family N-acetyltransferase [Jatrophihabitantaceae bacterium]
MVEPAWVGRRIVMRHAVDRDESGRLRFADVVGDLVALSDEKATVETRAGRRDVPVAHVAVAKVVEPAAAEILALEATAAQGWRARETLESHGWLLRADAGYTSRANSVLPGAQLTVPLDAALDEAREWYAARGLPLQIQLPLHARRLLDAELGERGWPATPDTWVLAGRIDTLRADGAARDDVHIAAAPDDAWVARFRDGAMPPAARELLTRHDRAGFAEIRRDGATVAIGRGAVDGGWLGITAVEVDPDARRQGLAQAIMRALWRWAADEHGATRSYVQVVADNDAALTLYERLGYWQHHVYRYRTMPA